MTDSRPRGPRAFFYVQHLLGIGHLARASRIARALAEDGFEVTVVTGGTPVPGFPGPLVQHVALPPITSGDAGFSGLADINGNPVDDAFKESRKEQLLAAFHQSQPDIVIIEAFPFGRRQVRFELLPLLEAIAAMENKPLVVTSLRDILQERSKPGRDEETVALVKQYFDRILVHGDPAFARLEDTFPLAAEITDKVIYTGLVAAPAPAQPTERFDVIVSAGGGAVGNALIRAALEAAKSIGGSLSWALITGPNLPQSDFDAISADAPAHVSVYRFRPDFAGLLAGAKLSVSQAGYNTVCDILRAGCHALLIPFTAGGETEQTVRAERLEKLGLAHILTEDDLSAESMTRAIETALAATNRPPHTLDLDGAQRTAEILRGLI
ncbi:glycosyl transferase [Rhizobium sp. Root73]|uniref:glycosyltransferase family protein n=1 Tax=unclassified Rhizobium TaxID=2613769 RepID=UPI0007147832|nr:MULTISPECIES: glycosyltransferase [unclassified Rhizobium]KQV30070.1 glycosyl transferase [Rhizobium sp. Root1204]KQY01178.1 glycosyl transferase [Rhizobium sp. Root1334]KRB96640.1 glycosyl transferase [Rhizobium sp. Root73]